MPPTDETAAALQKAETERDEAKTALEKEQSERAELQKQLDDANAELAKAGNDGSIDDDEDDDEDLNKADLPDPVRKRLEKAEADQAAMAERLQKAEEDAKRADDLAKAERDQRVTREFVAKAEKEFPHLGKADELGPRLKRMSETLAKEDYDAHLTELTAANEQIAKGALFSEFGVGGDGNGGDDAGVELFRKAEEIRKADPSISEWDALEQARKADREGQARHLDKVR